jgi:hypothetical protein
MKYLLSLLFFALALATTVHGQDIEVARLKWVTTEATDIKSNQLFALTSFIITDGNTITWHQKGGENVQTFTTSSKSGTWRDVSTKGSCDFRAIFQNEPGEVRLNFEKKSSGTWITIYFMPSDPAGLVYKLKVTEVIAL